MRLMKVVEHRKMKPKAYKFLMITLQNTENSLIYFAKTYEELKAEAK